MTLSERIYRMLLKAYPSRYRRRYEEPMAQLFGDQLRAANTPWKLLKFWLRMLADLLRTIPAQRADLPRKSYGIEGWTTPSRRAVFYARYEASSFGRREITPEDLLMGILREDRGFQPLAAAREAIHREIEAHETAQRRTPPMEDLRGSFPLRRILDQAKEEAERSHAEGLETRHLLGALLREEESLAGRILRRYGVTFDQLRNPS